MLLSLNIYVVRRDPEIDENHSVIHYPKVFRLNILVNVAMLMKLLDSLDHLDQNLSEGQLVRYPLLLQVALNRVLSILAD